jgi:ABC-type phosphate/phosphonate transport system substrate-binding protein
MYPFESVAWAWDELWRAVQARVAWLPAALTRSGDVHARWYDPDCLVTHICGAPFAALHHGDMRLIGAFDLDIAEAEAPGHYRSVLLSPVDGPLPELLAARPHAVANSADSLSGWLSLLAATVGAGEPWPGEVTFTSAHLDSVRALAGGTADIAAVDPWSLTFIAAEEPDAVAPLHRVGLGPLVPTPAIAVRKSLDAAHAAAVREAFVDALTDPATAAARAALRITGFADNTLDDYRSTLRLIPR